MKPHFEGRGALRLRALQLNASSIALTALFLAAPANAQTNARTVDDGAAAESAAASAEARSDQGATAPDIVVTGSRVISDGMNAPTPVTVVSSQQLTAARPGNLAEAVGELPAFRGSTRASSAGSAGTTLGAGANLLSLRALSPFRTLVLLDGRRIVPTQLTGATDANLIPQGLVKRVDVVTGGASAAYGSDAVAGVVNFVLDTEFEGVKANAQGGISSRGDGGNMKASLSVGKSFSEGRGHILLSGDYFDQDGIGLNYRGREWAEAGWGLIGYSTTSPQLIVAPDVRDSWTTAGGVIMACQPAGVACPLARQQFNPDGTLSPYVQGANVSAATMSGGDGAVRRANLLAGYRIYNLFGRGSYEIADGHTAFLEGGFSEMRAAYFGFNSGQFLGSQATIFRENAYLPDAIHSAMLANNIQSFTVGRTNYDFGPMNFTNTTRTRRVVGGIDGPIGGGWSYSVYASYGRSTFNLLTTNNPHMENLYNAIDAVRDPVSGNIVCRTTLLGQANGQGCVPINMFGDGAPSQAALGYVLRDTFVEYNLTQFVTAGSVRGTLLTLPAGDLSVAAGLEYRRETADSTNWPDTDVVRTGAGIRGYPAAQRNQPGAFFSSPSASYSGDFNVKEGFVELAAPLLREVPVFHSLDVNAAVRYADYSSVGGVVTWKGGAVWSPIEDIRLRVTRSRDIRAPSILERFSPPSPVIGQPVNDPLNGGARVSVTQVNVGNINLSEETANTLTLGAVLQPRFLPGFTFSVDYFDIKIDDVVAAPTREAVLAACGTSCPEVIRNPDGSLNSIITMQQNMAQLRTKGEDYEMSYSTGLDGIGADGVLIVRLLATHTRSLQLIQGGSVLERVGDLNVVTSQSIPGVAKWTGSLSADLRLGDFQIFVQQRYIGKGNLDKIQTYHPTQDTRIPSVSYTDLTLGYTLPTSSHKMDVYFTVNNLFDKSPPIAPNGATIQPRASNGMLYDFVGRAFTGGVRFKF